MSERPIKRRSLYDTYPNPTDNGYGKLGAEKRFSILQRYSFNSVLDVGSGPCFLQDWLQRHRPKVQYEAVDIRPDALKHCRCNTYEAIPKAKRYDLVCLFGTITYNIDGDELKNKSILKSLLREAKEACKETLLFTVFRDEYKAGVRPFQQDHFVCFSKLEIRNLLLGLGIPNFSIIEDDNLDKNEYFVVCTM